MPDDLHLTPIPASSLKEGQTFYRPVEVDSFAVQELARVGVVWLDDQKVRHDQEVLAPTPCPASRKWEALRERLGELVSLAPHDTRRALLSSVLRWMDDIDKEQGADTGETKPHKK